MGSQQKCLRELQPALHLQLPSYSISPCSCMGELPREWKHALIAPIPKSNELQVSTVCNYRLISLLPILNKVLERHVHSLFLKHLCSNDPISNSQFGFLKGRSTTGALVSTVNDRHTHLDNGLNACIVFLTLKKKNSVPHIALLKKLAALNLNLCLYRWIANYLYQRTLGVWITSDLSWTKQIEENCKKANKKLEWFNLLPFFSYWYTHWQMPVCCFCLSALKVCGAT